MKQKFELGQKVYYLSDAVEPLHDYVGEIYLRENLIRYVLRDTQKEMSEDMLYASIQELILGGINRLEERIKFLKELEGENKNEYLVLTFKSSKK